MKRSEQQISSLKNLYPEINEWGPFYIQMLEEGVCFAAVQLCQRIDQEILSDLRLGKFKESGI